MYFDDLKLGMKIEHANAKIDREEMLAFAKRFDNVPLHTDEEYAKSTKFGQIIAPGVYSFMAVWSEYLKADIFGEQLLAGKSTKIEWFKPVFAGDELSAKTYVSALTERNEKNGIAELTSDIFNQNGEQVMKGVTEAIVKKRIK